MCVCLATTTIPDLDVGSCSSSLLNRTQARILPMLTHICTFVRGKSKQLQMANQYCFYKTWGGLQIGRVCVFWSAPIEELMRQQVSLVTFFVPGWDPPAPAAQPVHRTDAAAQEHGPPDHRGPPDQPGPDQSLHGRRYPVPGRRRRESVPWGQL